MSLTYLKVKIKSLAEESKIIRKEEFRAKSNPELRRSLYEHRISPVGSESRATFIAYGFLRGRKYSEVERPVNKFSLMKCWRAKRTFGIPPSVQVLEYYSNIPHRAFTLINKYGNRVVTMEEFETWLTT